jgi:hypothetical protein
LRDADTSIFSETLILAITVAASILIAVIIRSSTTAGILMIGSQIEKPCSWWKIKKEMDKLGASSGGEVRGLDVRLMLVQRQAKGVVGLKMTLTTLLQMFDNGIIIVIVIVIIIIIIITRTACMLRCAHIKYRLLALCLRI